MTEPLSVNIEIIDAIPEISLIHLLREASKFFDGELSADEKSRAIKYFAEWSDAEDKAKVPLL